jgi:DNA topoisomerase II
MVKPNVSSKYKKLEPREHVLARPGMYIGSVDSDEVNCWIYSDEMKYDTISYISGLYKIYDEILVNVLDHVVRCTGTSKPVKQIKVNICGETGKIEVYNSGEGIEIEKHDVHDVYIPELIFGNMLTSTNYDDEEERTIGGQNGIGAKACNIYSTKFTIETVDSTRNKHYYQEFHDNMSKKTEPQITKYTKIPFTKITFIPDYAKFGVNKLSKDMFYLMKKRVYDMCALTPTDVKVSFNDEKIETKNFETYTNLYLGASKTDCPRVYLNDENDRWNVCVSSSNQGFQQVSFVNGIYTLKGGKHVEYILNQITKKLCEMILKKRKATVKQHIVKDNLFIFVKAVINNPTFDSQTKETLTTPYSKFGSKFDMDDKMIEKIYKLDVVQKVIDISLSKDTQDAKKTDGRKKTTIRGIAKLDDANWAGSAKSSQCILILTEGDSAKSMAISGLSEVGRDKYGVFPLKGKIMNVKDLNTKRINENDEISNLKKIMGLETNKVYTSVDELRYGSIMILTDADADGSHIKGLLFNLFHSMWPSLMKLDKFMISMLTPIIKITKGKHEKSFYTLTEYDNWKNENESNGWNVKYYKGLGTSTNKEAKEYFKNMKCINYTWEDTSNENIELAFNKKRADDRKTWLYSYDKNNILQTASSNSITDISYSDFINKDLIHFSNYNVERSIPNICDGLKLSLRKILYCCIKRNLYKEIKVAQLAGYVSEHGGYHHGEASLQDAIIGMAQTFVGSNNINILSPNGQFGTRIQGGKDSASPRYIHTELNKIIPYIYHPDDNDILEYTYDDGVKTEPTFYIPIIPMILINGTSGIGTGFSTNVPSFNPKDVIQNLENLMDNKEMVSMEPWFRGFKGTNTNGVSKGCYKKVTKTKIEITELPIGYWTEDFKTNLESYIEKNPKIIKDYESHYTEKSVHFTIHFQSAEVLDNLLTYNENKDCTNLEIELKMTSTRQLSATNMHLYSSSGNIKKYDDYFEILQEFYTTRMRMYAKRKKFKMDKLQQDLKFMNSKIKFITDIIESKLNINNVKKQTIIDYLEHNEFPIYDDGYEYLLRMPVYSLTHEKKTELEKEYENKSLDMKTLEALTEIELWKHDLQELKKQLVKHSY